MREDTRSLWEQYDSEVEPWRSGRLVLLLIALFSLVLQALSLAAHIVVRDAEQLLPLASVIVLSWLQFYLIWIGINWVRWLAGAWSGFTGFALVIWGWGDNNGLFVAFGCINLIIGSYLGLSPSVYFFAKRQRERRNWPHSLMVAAVFGLLFMSLFLGGIGTSAYKAQLEAEACDFGYDAFDRIFASHDTYFFLDRLTEHGIVLSGGRDQAMKFLQNTTIQAGDVREIKRPTAKLKLSYSFPTTLGCAGTLITEGIGAHGPVQLRMDVVQTGQSWRIETIVWHYRDYDVGARRQIKATRTRTPLPVPESFVSP